MRRRDRLARFADRWLPVVFLLVATGFLVADRAWAASAFAGLAAGSLLIEREHARAVGRYRP